MVILSLLKNSLSGEIPDRPQSNKSGNIGESKAERSLVDLHMVCYSTDDKSGFLTKQGIVDIQIYAGKGNFTTEPHTCSSIAI